MNIIGKVSIDRDSEGQLFLAGTQIVISDEANNVVCLVPWEPTDDDDDSNPPEALAEEIVRRLNRVSHRQADPQEDTDAPPAPAGTRKRAGVEYGCGVPTCTDCYEPLTTAAAIRHITRWKEQN